MTLELTLSLAWLTFILLLTYCHWKDRKRTEETIIRFITGVGVSWGFIGSFCFTVLSLLYVAGVLTGAN